MPLAALLQASPSAPSRRLGGTRTQTPAQRRVLLAYIGLNAALDVVWLLTFGRSHPDLVRERLRPGPGARENLLETLVLYGLHDHPMTHFALLLVGGDGCWEVLSREPMLRSRICRRVIFRPLNSRQVLEMVRRYHPLYHDVSEDLVRFIDSHFGHGNFRNWAAFTRSAQTLCQQPGRGIVDEAIARNVFALHGGGADAW